MKKNNNLRARVVGTLASTSALFLLLAAFAETHAAPWELSIDAEAGVIHSNNLLLGPADDEQNDTVFTIAPTFLLATEGDRTQAQILYAPEAYYYSNFDGADEVFQVADASLTTALVRERLFLSLNGVHFQSIVSPEEVFPTSNIPVTGNRVDSTVFEVRPYWQQRIGTADLRAEVGYIDQSYDGDQFQGSQEKDASLGINNFSQQEGLAWGFDYSFRRLEYDLSTPFEFQRASLNLGFWVSGSLRLFAVGGAETSFDNLLESNLDDDFWEAGFQFQPNQRFGMEIAAGDRSYGTSLRGDINYTMRRGTIGFTYNESPTTRADNAFSTRPRTDTDPLDSILNQPGNSDRFVRKRGELHASIELAKSTLTVRVFSEGRENRTDDTGVALATEDLSGTAVRWEWRAGPKTTFDIGGDLARRDDGTNKDDLSRFSVGVDYRLSARTSLRVEGHRAKQDRDTGGLGNYTENQGRLLLRVELM